jgi:hypothetical protein
MAFPTANVRIKTGSFRLLTKRSHLDTALEGGSQWAGHLAAQLHEFASICHADGGNRTGTAQFGFPGSANQATLFMVTTAVVVAIKILAFRSSRCFHCGINKLPQFSANYDVQGRPAGGFDHTRVRYSPVRVSTRMVSPSLTKFGHCTSKPVSTLTFLVTPVAVSPRTATSA